MCHQVSFTYTGCPHPSSILTQCNPYRSCPAYTTSTAYRNGRCPTCEGHVPTVRQTQQILSSQLQAQRQAQGQMTPAAMGTAHHYYTPVAPGVWRVDLVPIPMPAYHTTTYGYHPVPPCPPVFAPYPSPQSFRGGPRHPVPTQRGANGVARPRAAVVSTGPDEMGQRGGGGGGGEGPSGAPPVAGQLTAHPQSQSQNCGGSSGDSAAPNAPQQQ